MEKKQLIISTYYAKLKRDANIIYLLRKATISIRHHRKTLENNLMMSLIQSNVPKHFLARLKEWQNNDDPWTVICVRTEFKKIITAQEIRKRLKNLHNDTSLNNDQRLNSHQATVAFLNSKRQRSCIYCWIYAWALLHLLQKRDVCWKITLLQRGEQ